MDNKIKILYFGPKVNKGVGGSARLDNMLNILEKKCDEINIISYDYDHKNLITKDNLSDKVTITTVFVKKSLPKFLKVLSILILFSEAIKYIKKTDIIFAHGPYMTTGFPALFLSKIFRKPLIVDHMDIIDSTTPKFLYNLILKNSIVFAISEYLKLESKKIGSKDVLYIPIFINPTFFKKDKKNRSLLRTELGIKNEDIVIGYSGSFWYVEGVPILISAFKNLLKTHKNIKLIIIGHSNVPNSDNISLLLKKLDMEDNIILLPPQPYDKIPEYLSVFDIACSPKLDCEVNRAANPIKIYEYMSMELLAVVSNVGEISKIIDTGENGFLVKPGSIIDLEKTLDQILNNLNNSYKIGENARKTILKSFTQEKYKNLIFKKLDELVIKKNG